MSELTPERLEEIKTEMLLRVPVPGNIGQEMDKATILDLVAEVERLQAALSAGLYQAMLDAQHAVRANNEAARLQAENAKLRAALQSIADYGLSLDHSATASTAAVMAKAALEAGQ